ncbi:hypothetical protein Lal_00037454 [Lupinus albus]|uniref:Uncharacterized protein n=1 Tax=Lupinus albus TaxID=3870 RepID=A0A6A5P0X3_LUPAL|nr:hypothetical protein Lalb_Chr18g0056231 [Lupinus albus]KAF1890883.1 hypothetical protein Lal_00037454 [Lupinus albus]
MSVQIPVAIGTTGTIGSLVMKEIEYFTKFELDTRGSSSSCSSSSQKLQQHFVDMDRSYSISRPSFWALITTWKRRKKRRDTSRFIPKICSVTEVAETNQLNRIPGYSYRILKNDINNFHL